MNLSYQQNIYLWTTLLMEELVRNNVTHVVLSPGARSTPLTIAAARNDSLHKVIAYDERGAAYLALGMAKSQKKPVILISTSGTAVANYFPAIIEAKMSQVPLIVITADRPPELRFTGANQTILQPGIFGAYTNWEVDIPVPDPQIPLTYILTTVDYALYHSMYPIAGPVHVNMMFRKPLEPVSVEQKIMRQVLPQKWLHNDKPYVSISRPEISINISKIQKIKTKIQSAEAPFLFVGQGVDISKFVSELKQIPIPVTLDGAVSAEIKSPNFFPYLDLALLNPRFQEQFQPDVWLHLGDRPTSSRVEKFLKNTPFKDYFFLHPSLKRSDPNFQVTEHHVINNEHISMLLKEIATENIFTDWTKWFSGIKQKLEVLLQTFLDESEELTEWGIVRRLWELLPSGHHLFLANSLAVRLVDMFISNDRSISLFTNRGVSGIDGLIATSTGIALSQKKPLTLFIGDLAFHHDMNSLDLMKYITETFMIVIVLNNHGGGIFHFLPVAEEKDVFESYFATPHDYHFEHLARHFQLDYYGVQSHPEEFTYAYQSALQKQKHAIIEIHLNREKSNSQFNALVNEIKNLQI